MDESGKLFGRLKDLSERSYKNNIYTFTDFLSLADISEVYKNEREFSGVQFSLFGGNEACERKMLRFGSEKDLGYIVDFPISVIRISPLMDKFSDDLTHRDFLGAIMNLGIVREKVGDIFVKNNKAFVFCEEDLAEYICHELTRVKHTSVKCEIAQNPEGLSLAEKKEMSVSVASERIDGVVAHVYKLSRNEASELFVTGKIFLNGRLCENESKKLEPGDIVSVRGHGRFEFASLGGVSRKGKQYVSINLYV